MTLEVVEPVITAIASGVLYAMIWYVNKSLDPKSPVTWTDIDPYKILAIGLTGAVIGVASIVGGVTLTQASFEAQILTYGALTAVIERFARTGWNILKSKGIV